MDQEINTLFAELKGKLAILECHLLTQIKAASARTTELESRVAEIPPPLPSPKKAMIVLRKLPGGFISAWVGRKMLAAALSDVSCDGIMNFAVPASHMEFGAPVSPQEVAAISAADPETISAALHYLQSDQANKVTSPLMPPSV